MNDIILLVLLYTFSKSGSVLLSTVNKFGGISEMHITCGDTVGRKISFPCGRIRFVVIVKNDYPWLLSALLFLKFHILYFYHFCLPFLVTLDCTYISMIVGIHDLIIRMRFIDDN